MPELKDNERDVLLSFASRVDRNDPGALNNLGVLYYRKGVFDEAIKQFKEALKIDPRFELARENLLHLFSETDMEDPDVSKWRQEVEEDPGNDEALFRLGVSYQNMGRLDEASETLGQVVARNPDHYMARIHLGSVLKARGLNQQALEHYLCAADNVSKSAVFHTDLGEIYYNLGRTDEAISELMAAIKLDAEFWRSHFLLSFAFGDIGHYQDALEENRIASKLNPSFQNTEANLALSEYGNKGQGHGIGKEIPSLESTSFTLGTAYRERGYLKEALKEFRKAIQEMQEKDRVYIEIGKVYLAEGNDDEALASFLKALEDNPENSEAYRLCGCIYHLADEYMKAAGCYLQSFRLDCSDADTMNNLGVLLYQVGLVEEAERMFKKGMNLKLYNLQLNYNYLGCILFREEYMMAENLLQRLEAFTGKSAILYEKRALLHYKLNRMTLSLFDIESALSCDRNHADALYLKGLIFLREEKFQGAIQCIMEAANIFPEYTGMHFFISHGEQIKADPLRTNFKMPAEPPEELIELLQAGVNRRFDKIRENLESVVEEGKKYLEGEKNSARERGSDPTSGQDAADSIDSSKSAERPEITEDEASANAGLLVDVDNDDSIDLLKDLDLKI